jgi:hypothetical protein
MDARRSSDWRPESSPSPGSRRLAPALRGSPDVRERPHPRLRLGSRSIEKLSAGLPRPGTSPRPNTQTRAGARPGTRAYRRVLSRLSIRHSVQNAAGTDITHKPLIIWWVLRGSNPRHSPCKGDALPAELSTPAHRPPTLARCAPGINGPERPACAHRCACRAVRPRRLSRPRPSAAYRESKTPVAGSAPTPALRRST